MAPDNTSSGAPKPKRAPKSQTTETRDASDVQIAGDVAALSAWARARRFMPLIVIFGALMVFFLLGGADYINLETLRENRAELTRFVSEHFVWTLIIFMAVYTALVAISFPGAGYLSIFGGFLFGAYIGTAAVVIAATLGATIIFLAARRAIGSSFTERAGPYAQKFEAGLKDNELSYLFILRLVPIFPFFIVNVVPALFDVKVRNYVLATFFGIIPGSFVYVSLGDGIGALFDAGEDVKLSGLMTEPRILVPIIGLIILSLIPVIFKRVKSVT